jgi:hypothetical protein
MSKTRFPHEVTLVVDPKDAHSVITKVRKALLETPDCKFVETIPPILMNGGDTPIAVIGDQNFYGEDAIIAECERIQVKARTYESRQGKTGDVTRYDKFNDLVEVLRGQAPLFKEHIEEFGERAALLGAIAVNRPGLSETIHHENAGKEARPGIGMRGKFTKGPYSDHTSSPKLHFLPSHPAEMEPFRHVFGNNCFGVKGADDFGVVRPANSAFNDLLKDLGFRFDGQWTRYPSNWDNQEFLSGYKDLLRKTFGEKYVTLFEELLVGTDKGILECSSAPPRADDVLGVSYVKIYFSYFLLTDGKTWVFKIGSPFVPGEREIATHVEVEHFLVIDYGTPALEAKLHRDLEHAWIEDDIFEEGQVKELVRRITAEGYLSDFISPKGVDRK